MIFTCCGTGVSIFESCFAMVGFINTATRRTTPLLKSTQIKQTIKYDTYV